MNPFYKIGGWTSFYHVATNPKQSVILWQYQGQTVSDSGIEEAFYSLSNDMATIQIPTVQELEQMQFINTAGVKRKFLFDTEAVGPLNRNLNKGEDYIEWDQMYYSVFLIEQQNINDNIIVWGIEQKTPPGQNNQYTIINPVVNRNILK